MTVAEIKEGLTKLGVEFDPTANKATLEELLKSHSPDGAAPKEESDGFDFDVGDPEVLRPVELPLVIKPKNGKSWLNDNQATYARILNGYAYKNPEKWAKKKNVLLKRLVEIGEDASRLDLYMVQDGNVTFKNKIIEK